MAFTRRSRNEGSFRLTSLLGINGRAFLAFAIIKIAVILRDRNDGHVGIGLQYRPHVGDCLLQNIGIRKARLRIARRFGQLVEGVDEIVAVVPASATSSENFMELTRSGER